MAKTTLTDTRAVSASRHPVTRLLRCLLLALLLVCAAASARADSLWTLPEGEDIRPILSGMDGGFLVTVGRQYLRYDPGREEPAQTIPAEGDWVSHDLYADDQGTFWGLSGQYNQEGMFLRQVELRDGKARTLRTYPEPDSFSFTAGPTIQGDTAIFYGRKDASIFGFLHLNLTTGESSFRQEPANLRFAQPYRDGLFIACHFDQGRHQNSVVLVDPLSGITERLLILDRQPDALTYCPQTHLLAWVISPHVYAYTPGSGEEPTRQGYLPVQGDIYRSPPSMALNSANVCALLDGDLLRCTTLNPDWEDEKQMLSIAAIMNDPQETRLFRRIHPEIPVESIRYGINLTPSWIADQLRTGSDAHDIFMQYSSLSGYGKLLTRGFAEDLSGSDVLTAFAQTLTPTVREAVTVDGRLMAVPVNIDFSSNASALAYDEGLLADLGLAPEALPGDLLSLLTQLTQWYDEGVLTDARVLGGAKQSDRLYSFTFYCYTYYAAADDGWPDYQSPLFLDLMTQCQALIDAMARRHCLEGELPALFKHATLDEWLRGELSQEGFGFLPLTPAQGMAQQHFANLTVAILNPRSTRREQAMTYLETVSQHLDPIAQLYLCPAFAETATRPDYELVKSSILGNLSRFDPSRYLDPGHVLTREEQEEKAYWEQRLRTLEERERWIVSPEMIEAAQTVTDQVALEAEFLFSALEIQVTRSLFERFLDGQISVQQFANEASRIEQMAKMEEN